jgi:hypothetical protein
MHDTSDIIPKTHTGFPLNNGQAYNLTDAFALAWIFGGALSAGLVLLNPNELALLSIMTTLALAGIWWQLTRFRRR